ncbi:ATP-binding protein [Nostoc sp. TCL26-01]|uniref:ATP-binding protein n=1 Tax=Nostoc sp. TCL26-01 TaxID=2576904 RepID=UPI001C4BE4A2|nr:ATP-binding protein [Nostoc sp. TCL26-01]
MSFGVNHFINITDEVKQGQDVRVIFPELAGLEDIFAEIRQGKQNNFELKGIRRSRSVSAGESLDIDAPLYIDICIAKNLQTDDSRTQLIMVVEDVTERMVLEQKLFQGANEANLLLRNLKASKQYIDQIVTSMADALLVTTLSGEIKKLNPAAQVLLEYDDVELIGQPITKVLQEVNIESSDLSRSLQLNPLLKEVETVCCTKNGKKISVAFSSSIVKTEIEHFQGYVYILRNMTERKQVELAKQEFLAMISHEVRTPISSVTGIADLLLDTELSGEQRDFIETIYTSGNSLLKIINDFLDFSKIQSGLELEYQPFNLRNCIQEALNLLKHKAQEKNLQLTFIDTHEFPKIIVGDIIRVRQILINLISNAIKFTATGGIEVSFISRQKGNLHDSAANTYEIQFTVKDTGMGIPSDRLERLFKAFSQANSSITREYGGTGLGLAICKRLCELMGGKIWVESEINVGSTFYFTITADVMLAEAETRTQELAAKKDNHNCNVSVQNYANLRILLTEDNLVNQKVALKQLKSLGCSADVANNGKEALEILEKVPYDLILMDCQMPILDGLETTKEIHRWPESRFASGRRPVVIAMTANAMKEDQKMCLDAGMDDYLSKPVMKEILAKTLDVWAKAIFQKQASEQTISSENIDLVDLPINWEHLHRLTENDREFEIQLLQIFVEDIHNHLEIAKLAIAAHDFAQLAQEAHQMKGASGNVGATTMFLAADELEKLAHHQERRGTANLISDLEGVVKRIQEYLKSVEV